MLNKKVFAFFFILGVSVVFLFLWPIVAYADAPCPYVTVTFDFNVPDTPLYGESGPPIQGWIPYDVWESEDRYYVDDGELWTYDGNNGWVYMKLPIASFEDRLFQQHSLLPPETYSGTISIGQVRHSSTSGWSDTRFSIVSGGYDVLAAPSLAFQTLEFTKTNALPVTMWRLSGNFANASRTIWDNIEIKIPCENFEEEIEGCLTVSDSHFTGAITYTWVLQSATISDSILSLNPDGSAAQSLITLTNDTEYNAIISITNVVTPATLNVVLGTESHELSITGTNNYVTQFTTPSNLGGPLVYVIENTSADSSTIEIDYTCLFFTGEGQPDCLAPANGDFDTADDWYWYRGAVHQPIPQNAYLPFNEGGESDKSLLLSSSIYTLPTISEDEYLLLEFSSETQLDQSAFLGTRVASGIGITTAETIYTFEIYPYVYEFQADISSMAGLSETTVAFANTGEDPLTGLPAEDHIYLDDVCIYVSDEPPILPAPVDSDPILPSLADNLTCYSCSTIPGILYGYGLPVYYLMEVYDNGVSVWDPVGWVPWLASALWVNIGYPLACFVLSLWCWLLGLYQFALNEFSNWFQWGRRSIIAFKDWVLLLFVLLWQSLTNITAWLWEIWSSWLNWGWQAIKDILTFLFVSLWNLARWIGEGLIWLASNIGFSIFETIANWFIDGLNGLIALGGWIVSELFGLLVWLLNLGKGIFENIANWFISGLNGFIALLGWIVSGLLGFLAWLWNLICPLLERLWSYLSSVPLIALLIGLLLDLISAGWNLFMMLATWIWENVFELISFPLQFYNAFDAGVASSSFDYLLSCESQNFWCSLLAGFQLVNQSAGQSVIYPAVIVGVILTTLFVFWKDIRALFSVNIR